MAENTSGKQPKKNSEPIVFQDDEAIVSDALTQEKKKPHRRRRHKKTGIRNEVFKKEMPAEQPAKPAEFIEPQIQQTQPEQPTKPAEFIEPQIQQIQQTQPEQPAEPAEFIEPQIQQIQQTQPEQPAEPAEFIEPQIQQIQQTQPEQPAESQPEPFPQYDWGNPMPSQPTSQDAFLSPKTHENRYREEDNSPVAEPFIAPEEPFKPVVSPEEEASKWQPFGSDVVEDHPVVEKKIEGKEKDEFESTQGETNPFNEPADKGEIFESSDSEKQQSEDTIDSINSNVEVTDVSPSETPNEDMETPSGFFEMLSEAGIQKKHIYMVLAAFGLIVLIVLTLVFGWYRIVTDLFTSSPVEQTYEQVPPEKENNEQTDAQTDESTDKQTDIFPLSGIINSYIFGLEFSKDSPLTRLDLTPVSGGTTIGIESAIAAGSQQPLEKDTYQYDVELLMKIDNAMKTDVYELLNKYVDRRAALVDHLKTLQQLLLEAESIQTVINQEMVRVDVEYKKTDVEKSTHETAYFNDITKFYGEQAFNDLQLFIETSQVQVKLRANYNALKTLSEMYATKISELTPRIQDINLNSEALIKGIRVYEVPNSNINTIILNGGR